MSVGRLDEVERLVAAHPGPLVVIFDVDNTIVPQGAGRLELATAVESTIERFESLPGVERVIMLTNGGSRGVERMIGRGNKPWTTRRRLRLTGTTAEIWVVGDQVLTDGALAWRLGGSFVHLAIDETGEHATQAAMRSLGRVVAPLLFRRG